MLRMCSGKASLRERLEIKIDGEVCSRTVSDITKESEFFNIKPQGRYDQVQRE